MPQNYYRVLLLACGSILLLLIRYLRPENLHAVGSDESCYLEYAKYISIHGIDGVEDLINWYAQSVENRFHPSPARIGYLFLSALLIKIFGISYSVLVSISYFSFFAFCCLNYIYAKKIFGRDFSICLLLMLLGSPLSLGMASVALSDSLLNFTWGAVAWSFLDYLCNRTNLKLGFLIFFLILSVLVKESSVVLFVFIVLFMVYAQLCLKIPVRFRDLWLIFLIPFFVVGALYLIFLGGIQNILTLIYALYQTHFVDQANLYALNFSRGPWFRYLVDFLLLSPVITLVAIGYVGYCIFNRVKDWKKNYFLMYFIVIYTFLNLLAHTKVVRFVINLEMVLAVFCTWGIFTFFKADLRYGRWWMVLVTFLIIFVISFNSFLFIFTDRFILDPITYHLAQTQGLIPSISNR